MLEPGTNVLYSALVVQNSIVKVKDVMPKNNAFEAFEERDKGREIVPLIHSIARREVLVGVTCVNHHSSEQQPGSITLLCFSFDVETTNSLGKSEGRSLSTSQD